MLQGRTFGTHTYYIALNPAQLRKSGVVMIRSTHFGVPSSVASVSEPFPCNPFYPWSQLLHASLLMHCGSKQPATASGVAIIYMCHRRPGMSPTPRSAQYPATHSCHHLRGGENVRLWSSSSPSVIVSDNGGVADAALRQSTATMPPVGRKCAVQAARAVVNHFRAIRFIRVFEGYTLRG